MARYTRVARQEFPSTDPARRGAIDVAYVYMDERCEPVMIKLPLSEDNPERVAEELRARAAAAEGAGAAEIEI